MIVYIIGGSWFVSMQGQISVVDSICQQLGQTVETCGNLIHDD